MKKLILVLFVLVLLASLGAGWKWSTQSPRKAGWTWDASTAQYFDGA